MQAALQTNYKKTLAAGATDHVDLEGGEPILVKLMAVGADIQDRKSVV